MTYSTYPRNVSRLFAGSAITTPAIVTGVRFGKLVTALAVGLLRFFGGKPFTAQNVLAWRNNLKMIRVDARSVAAKMVQVFSFWNWAFENQIGGAHSIANPLSINMASKHSVSSPIGFPCPNPAIFFVYLNFLKQSLFDCHRKFRAKIGIHIPVPELSRVMREAISLLIIGPGAIFHAAQLWLDLFGEAIIDFSIVQFAKTILNCLLITIFDFTKVSIHEGIIPYMDKNIYSAIRNKEGALQ